MVYNVFREVCQKLECCPYLFGPVRVGGECPSACQTRPKHQFLLETSKYYKHKGMKIIKPNCNILLWDILVASPLQNCSVNW